MHYSRALGKARQSGDEARIREAQQRHDDDRDPCLKSDRMIMTDWGNRMQDLERDITP